MLNELETGYCEENLMTFRKILSVKRRLLSESSIVLIIYNYDKKACTIKRDGINGNTQKESCWSREYWFMQEADKNREEKEGISNIVGRGLRRSRPERE